MSGSQDESAQRFFNIETSEGGKINLPQPRHLDGTTETTEDQKQVGSVGTYGCYTCVGVYIPLSKDSCFVAHMLATKKLKRWNGMVERKGLELDTNEDKNSLAEFVKEQIRNVVGADWPAEESYRDRVVIVCPLTRDATSGIALTGSVIVEAIIDALKIDNSRHLSDQEGFVVNHTNGEVNLIDHLKGDTDVVEMANHSLARLEELNLKKAEPGLQGLGNWAISQYDNGDWYVQPSSYPPL